jgi:hypothetical protein
LVDGTLHNQITEFIEQNKTFEEFAQVRFDQNKNMN